MTEIVSVPVIVCGFLFCLLLFSYGWLVLVCLNSLPIILTPTPLWWVCVWELNYATNQTLHCRRPHTLPFICLLCAIVCCVKSWIRVVVRCITYLNKVNINVVNLLQAARYEGNDLNLIYPFIPPFYMVA